MIDAPGKVPERKALEATAITLHRMESGRSPTANFGRVPPGYRISTGNNTRLVARGRRIRGGPDPQATITADSAPVAGQPGRDPASADWMNWAWTSWAPISEACKLATCVGIYRLRSTEDTGLTYVGQGIVASRLRSHQAKAHMQSHRQNSYFSGDMTASWVPLPGTAILNILEHENDLIAAHVLMTGQAPTAQFLG